MIRVRGTVCARPRTTRRLVLPRCARGASVRDIRTRLTGHVTTFVARRHAGTTRNLARHKRQTHGLSRGRVLVLIKHRAKRFTSLGALELPTSQFVFRLDSPSNNR